MSARLQEEPLMSGTPAGGGHSKPHFERHVESRDASSELNPTEVVEGIPARRDQFEDAIEPPCGTRDLERGPRAEPEGAETSDQRDEQPFVVRIVRDVEEGVLRGISLSDRSGSAGRSPPRHGPLLGVPLVLAGQRLCHYRAELAVAFAGDAEDAGRRSRCRVRRCDHRAGRKAMASLYAAWVFRVNVPGRIQLSTRAGEESVALSLGAWSPATGMGVAGTPIGATELGGGSLRGSRPSRPWRGARPGASVGECRREDRSGE